jgi:hypothetical protein
MNSLVETENLIALIFYKLKGQCMQVAAIPKETVKDVNARITLDKSTASENNIVNNLTSGVTTLTITMYQCVQEIHALARVFSASKEKHRICR